MSEPVDDFLMHYGVKGMKWGKRRASDDSGEPKPKMSREKKVAIAVGVAATVAIGAAVVFGVMDQKANGGAGFSFGDLPVQTVTSSKTARAGRANLIFSAAAMQQPVPPAPKKGLVDKAKEKGFNVAKEAAIKKIQSTSYDDFTSGAPKRVGIKAKAKGVVEDKANDIIIRKIASASAAKVAEMDAAKKKRKS